MNSAQQAVVARVDDTGAARSGHADASRPRSAGYADLAAINVLIAAAMDTWGLSDRVKRLSLPVYQYDAQDLDHLEVLVAETGDGRLTGIAAMEAAEASDCPRGRCCALLHGLYVDPSHHGEGIGSRLLHAVQALAASRGYDDLLVKANPAATSFFEARGFERLAVVDPAVDYPYRYLRPLRCGGDEPGRTG